MSLIFLLFFKTIQGTWNTLIIITHLSTHALMIPSILISPFFKFHEIIWEIYSLNGWTCAQLKLENPVIKDGE